jgi:hypothetical protein
MDGVPMRSLIILAFLATAIPAAAQDHLGHFKTNPNGTDSISTPSGTYGDPGRNASNNPAGNPYRMSGELPSEQAPKMPPATKTSGTAGIPSK